MAHARKPALLGLLLFCAVAGAGLVLWKRAPTPSLEGAALRADLSRVTPEVARRIEAARGGVRAGPRDAERWALLGLVHEANGLVDSAVECYANASALAPAEPRVWYRSAVAHAKLGDVARAAQHMERAALREPEFAPSHWLLGQWRLQLGDLTGAHESFSFASRIDPGDTPAWIGLARVYLQNDDTQLALQVLEHALTLRPGDRYARRLYADACRRAGRWDEVARNERLAGDVGGTLPDPRDADLEPYRVDSYHVDYDNARAALYRGRPELALPLLERLATARPEDLKVIQLLAHAHEESGALERAGDVYERALELAPRNSWTLVTSAHLLGRIGRAAEGLVRVELALEQDSTFGPAHEARASLLEQLDRRREALAAYRLGLEFDQRNPRTRLRLGQLELGLGLWRDAARTFERSLRSDHTSPEAHIGLARAHLELGSYADARAALAGLAAEPADAVELREVRRRLELEDPDGG